jgi:hypothetical protein
MTDYNLSGLNTRSFEQLIQAIAVKVFGPKTIIFGDGPDGGREATFDGTVPYPSKEQAWNGYGVVQAKFLQRPQGVPKDGEWALQQLRGELATYNVPSKGPKKKKAKVTNTTQVRKTARRTPDYYIFVTNAVLTPVGEQGTKDKAYKILEDFKTSAGLKDFDIWDYDKICAYLDGYEDIRHGYEGFISTGDVLARVVERLKPRRPDFKQVMYRFLQEELIADQYANLEQAGRATEDKVPIARVFVDLPTYSERLADPPAEEASTAAAQLRPGFIANIMEAAKTRLDPISLNTSEPSNNDLENVPDHDPGRFVLIGGPGQGKTTVGQFMCQLFRTAILKDRTDWTPLREVQDILDLINAQCQSECIELPPTRRFPIRIVLSDFAKELASPGANHITSVLSYITARIKKRTDHEVTASDLRLWMGNYPWLIIFDGLDEVPASSNRDEVLAAIKGFRIEINECNADVLIIATTRPQGYNEDFAPSVYEHKWLAPLSVVRAMHYARRLAEVRYVADKDRKQRVLDRLEQAAHTEATARLMRSPLQVTIMITLIGTRGTPPQERWSLFSEYYKVIYQRETEREIPASDILREYRSDIDRIHNRVGLILQAKSERSGETDARLSRQDFAVVVADRLDEEGHEGTERDLLQRQITNAATDRLVFLVGLQDDQIGFEIRSLQEFMAAEALMDEREEIVQRRLREIAPISNWRNVFLFAAGKCFAERQDLRDTIHTICAELNDSDTDEVSRTTLEGSRLALDLLDERITRTQPRFTRLLIRLALRLLNLTPIEDHTRLADLYEPGLEVIYREELNGHLALVDFYQQLGAWACLSRLIAADVNWARDLGDRHWPTSDDYKLDLLHVISGIEDESWRLSKLVEILPRLAPGDILGRREQRKDSIFAGIKFDSAPQWFREIMMLTRAELAVSDKLEVSLLRPNSTERGLSLTIRKATTDKDAWLPELEDLPSDVQETWMPFLAATRFLESPSKNSLALTLRQLAKVADLKSVKRLSSSLPWTLSACIEGINEHQDFDRLAEIAENGELGDRTDWEAAERRWSELGITSDDIEYMRDEVLPFDRHIAEHGFPFTAVETWSTGSFTQTAFASELIGLHQRIPASRVRDIIAGYVLFMMSVAVHHSKESASNEAFDLTFEQLTDLFDDASLRTNNVIHTTALSAYKWGTELDYDGVEFLDRVGRHFRIFASDRPDQRLTEIVSKAFIAHPHHLGLLRVLSMLIIRGGTPTVATDLLDPARYGDPLFRTAAILTRLAQQSMSVSEAERMANYAADLADGKTWAAETTLYMVERNQVPFNAALDKFLVTLRRQLPTTSWETIGRTINLLASSLKRRTSELDDASLWTALALRPNLNALVKGDSYTANVEMSNT